MNQNLGNALLQNLFLRFHNYIADKLLYINQFWTDEILYQESRRFIGAVIQHITYNHYLPIILGNSKMFYLKKKKKLKIFIYIILLGDTYSKYYGLLTPQTLYNDRINPCTSLEFATSSFRILHAQIPSQLQYSIKTKISAFYIIFKMFKICIYILYLY